jgi:hypothetical protein
MAMLRKENRSLDVMVTHDDRIAPGHVSRWCNVAQASEHGLAGAMASYRAQATASA